MRALTFQDFVSLRERIKKDIYEKKCSKENADVLTSDFSDFEANFANVHRLPPLKETFGQEIGEEIINLWLGSNHEATEKKPTTSFKKREQSVIVFHFTSSFFKKKVEGISANSGYAAGRVAIVRDWRDCDKVEEGDKGNDEAIVHYIVEVLMEQHTFKSKES